MSADVCKPLIVLPDGKYAIITESPIAKEDAPEFDLSVNYKPHDRFRYNNSTYYVFDPDDVKDFR